MDSQWIGDTLGKARSEMQEEDGPKISLLKWDIYSKNKWGRNRMLFYVRRALRESKVLIKSLGIAEAVISGDLHNRREKPDPEGKHYTLYMLNAAGVIVATWHIYVDRGINSTLLNSFQTHTKNATENLQKYTPREYPVELPFERLSKIYDTFNNKKPQTQARKPLSVKSPRKTSEDLRRKDKIQKRRASIEAIKMPIQQTSNYKVNQASYLRSDAGQRHRSPAKYHVNLSTNSEPASEASSEDEENKQPGSVEGVDWAMMDWEAQTEGFVSSWD